MSGLLSLLLIVCVLGIVAWVINASPLSPFFKNVAFGIMAIIILLAFFQVVLGIDFNLPIQ